LTTDRALSYPRVLNELLPSACHVTEQYTNNPIEADHGRLKSRLRPMRGLKRLRSARVISTGHVFIQNLHRGHYELATDIDPRHRIPGCLHRTHPRHLSYAPQRPTVPTTRQRNSALRRISWYICRHGKWMSANDDD
jgi:hypothetical protein